MNTTYTAPEPQFAGGLPEFLHALERLYRCLGLAPKDAQAATFADAEIFASAPLEPELAA